tara:strand:+ start:1323 stop:1934 length:612 start_codon:yes stop_codon:yes gene_type:complete
MVKKSKVNKNKSNKSSKVKMYSSSLKKEKFNIFESKSGNDISRFKKNGFYGAIVGNIIGIAITVMAYIWLTNLEKINCACSESWMRKYIKYYLIAYLAIYSLMIIINISIYSLDLELNKVHNNPLIIVFNTIVSVFQLFTIPNIIIVIIFIAKLKEMNCECSEDIKREVYWVYNIVLASIIGLALLLLLITVTGWSFSNSRKS